MGTSTMEPGQHPMQRCQIICQQYSTIFPLSCSPPYHRFGSLGATLPCKTPSWVLTVREQAWDLKVKGNTKHHFSWGSGRWVCVGFGSGWLWGFDSNFQVSSCKSLTFDATSSWDHCQNFYDCGIFWFPAHEQQFPWPSLPTSFTGFISI